MIITAIIDTEDVGGYTVDTVVKVLTSLGLTVQSIPTSCGCLVTAVDPVVVDAQPPIEVAVEPDAVVDAPPEVEPVPDPAPDEIAAVEITPDVAVDPGEVEVVQTADQPVNIDVTTPTPLVAPTSCFVMNLSSIEPVDCSIDETIANTFLATQNVIVANGYVTFSCCGFVHSIPVQQPDPSMLLSNPSHQISDSTIYAVLKLNGTDVTVPCLIDVVPSADGTEQLVMGSDLIGAIS